MSDAATEEDNLGEVVVDEPAAVPRPERQSTGDPHVDQAMAHFDSTDGQPLHAQIEAAEAVHRALQERLADAHE